jgi:hypothetical protein
MSTTISAVIINLLSVLLPKVGVQVGSDELTVTIQTLVAVATGLWIWVERVKRGDVTPLGRRKQA